MIEKNYSDYTPPKFIWADNEILPELLSTYPNIKALVSDLYLRDETTIIVDKVSRFYVDPEGFLYISLKDFNKIYKPLIELFTGFKPGKNLREHMDALINSLSGGSNGDQTSST